MPDRIDDLYSDKWFTDLERTISLLEKQEAQIKATNDAIRAGGADARGAKTMEDLANAQEKVATNTAKAAAGFDDFNIALKQAEALKAQYNGSTKEMVAITLSSAKATKELAQAAKIQQDSQLKAAAAAEKAAASTQKLADAQAKQLQVAQQRMAVDKVAEDSLKKMSDTLEQLRKGYNRLTAAERENAEIGGVRLARIKELDAALKAADANQGKYQRNVGNYSLATNGLRNSMQQLSRELPSISNGFATFASAIGNNIAPAQDAIRNFVAEQKALKAEGKPTQTLFQGLTASILNWQTGLLLAVTALTVYGKQIGEFISGLFKTKEALSSINKLRDEELNTRKEVSKALGQETAQLTILKAKIEDVNVPMAARLQAVKDIKEQFPEYFKDLTTEQILAGKVADAYIRARDAIVASAKVRVFGEQLGNVEGEIDRIGTRLREAAKNAGIAIDENVFGGGINAVLGPGGQIPFYKTGDKDKEGKDIRTDLISDTIRYNALLAKQADLTAKIQKNLPASAGGDRIDAPGKPKKVKAEKQVTDDIYAELIKQSENYAQVQKAISEDLDKSLDERLAAYDNYTRELVVLVGLKAAGEKAAEATYQKGITEVTIKALKERNKMIEDEQKRIQKNLSGISTGGATQTRDEASAEAYKKGKEFSDKSFQAVNDLASVYSALSQGRIQQIDQEIEAIYRRRDAEIEAYSTSAEFAFASERDRNIKIAAINQKARQEEDEQNRKRRQEMRTDAAIHKAITVAKIAIETALGVVHQLTSGDPYTAFGRAAAVGLLGAAQLAAAAAQPLPAFAEGTGPDGSPEGVAKVGERGSELGITKDGKMFLTPSTETKMYLEKGTHIIPADQTQDLLKYYALGMPGLRENPGKVYEMDTIMEGAANKIVNAIQQKRFPAQQQKPGWWDHYYYNHTK